MFKIRTKYEEINNYLDEEPFRNLSKHLKLLSKKPYFNPEIRIFFFGKDFIFNISSKTRS